MELVLGVGSTEKCIQAEVMVNGLMLNYGRSAEEALDLTLQAFNLDQKDVWLYEKNDGIRFSRIEFQKLEEKYSLTTLPRIVEKRPVNEAFSLK